MLIRGSEESQMEASSVAEATATHKRLEQGAWPTDFVYRELLSRKADGEGHSAACGILLTPETL
jgi:hypothetical protein